MQTWPIQFGIVIPLANEEATIDELLRRTLAVIDPDDRIYCVLDHVSKDLTRSKIESAAEVDARIILVWSPGCRCVVDAYFAGYRKALSEGCRWILEMDGGLSHLPEQIPAFRRAMTQGYDVAFGSRFLNGGSHQGSLWRRFVSGFGTLLSRLLLRLKMKDCTSGFECFTHRALQHVVDCGVMSRGHFFQTEIRFLLRDWNWVEVPITYSSPSPRLRFKTLIESLKCLWLLWRQRNRYSPRAGQPTR